MARVSAVIVAASMVVICASFGVVLYLVFGMAPTGALVGGIAALTGLALCSIVARGRSGTVRSTQVQDLSRGIADLARQVIELGRRVASMETKVADAVTRTDAAVAGTEPLTSEIGEIGSLIKQLAEQVNAHDLVLQSRSIPTREPPPADSGRDRATTGPEAPRLAMVSPVAAQRRESEEPATAGFGGLTRDAAVAVVRNAIEGNRVEFYLHPILTLPQRKVRFYEALARVRTAEDELLASSEFMPAATAAGLMPRIDDLMLRRCAQVVQRLMTKNRDVGLFCGVSPLTLVDSDIFPQFCQFLDENRTLAPSIVLEFSQAAYRSFGALERESLNALMDFGYRFSLDGIGDLRLEPRELAERGFRFVKVPAALLLSGNGGGDIDAVDLSGHLARYGLDLIAAEIETETTVVDLLDYDIRYGQGALFAQARPVRADVLQPVETVQAAEPEETAPAPPEPPTAAPVLRPAASAPRIEALERPTVIAQIARAVVARSSQ